ncbi:unnamed protein product [Parnassius apollo]|uniref:(apollo) hypothetical protein n=1 Tax=Parnassius apollo TaxID=110799 RepID=A0A8S3XJH1_PARAO|nr:unnamed protein product [Parnassius apollo]
MIKRSEQRREDARAAVSHQQMKSEIHRYPVDRYLVESSKKIEMVNITNDEIWNPEPAIRPEDEVILRKLHEMLQSTADDLKLISGELMKCREPRIQFKTSPTPLDEEFNEKVHIEEIVNAKFHGYKIFDKSPHKKSQNVDSKNSNSVPSRLVNKAVSAAVQVNQISASKKSASKKNLTISRTKIVQINEEPQYLIAKDVKPIHPKISTTNGPFVAYNEFKYKYEEPKLKQSNRKSLQIQEMPSINIRSELKEQKVLQLDILPEQQKNIENLKMHSNVGVIAMQYEPPSIEKTPVTHYPQVHDARPVTNKTKVRKVSKMLTCESSESTNHISSDNQDRINQNVTKSNIRSSLKSSTRDHNKDSRESKFNKNEKDKRQIRNIDEWKRQLDTIYGHPSTSRKYKIRSNSSSKESPTKHNSSPSQKNIKTQNILNNAEYIPYAKLTLGGVRVSDIEREISDVPDKNNFPLNPILDKILASRENSFHEDSSKINKEEVNKNILTTSDENLLEEVLDIERNIAETLSKNHKVKKKTSPESCSNVLIDNSESDKESYADDFEEEKSENTQSEAAENVQDNSDKINPNIHNETYTKSSNLSFKNSVDIFEFIHSIDTQDNATQSNTTHKISLKATQTSPRTNIQPIRNDLWPSVDQKDEVDQLLKEDFIRKLIVDECANILQKNVTQPSTSKDGQDNDKAEKNFTASQKNTQTSPAHVRSVMTSPTKTKTRTTSPFALSLTVDHQTSPIACVNNEELHIELDKVDDLAVSINLSSPRFSLRLPQSSREVMSNLDGTLTKRNPKLNKSEKIKTFRKFSSSSTDDNYSSSDISSLGEINNKFKRKLRKTKIPTVSDSSESSIASKYSSDLSSLILPLKSEGEISLGQTDKFKSRNNRSDGEVSLGQKIRYA